MLWLWNFFLDRRQFSYVLIVSLVIAGLYSLWMMPKENTPQIIIPNGIVTTVLPGASAEEIETLVTSKLEDQISGISNVEKITSNSSSGISVINVQFDASADVNQSIQDLRDAVAKVIPQLPSDATDPSVTKINFSDQPIIVVSISGDLSAIELSDLGKDVSDQIKTIAGVSEVRVAGVPSREVNVIVRKSALEQYGLRLLDVISAIGANNASAPAGAISINGVSYGVNFKGALTDPSQVADIAVGSNNGAIVYLRDIATISNGLAPVTTYSRLSLDGKPSKQAITLQVFKQSGSSIQGVANDVRAKMQELQNSRLKNLDVFIPPTTDQGAQVSKQLTELTQTGVETVVLVIFALLLTIGWRESLVAALSIPLSFLIAFIGLHLTGNTLNFISLFALILAVGILVDSGIVVTEAIHARMRTYATPLQAARMALHDYAWPLIAGTMATVAVFAPLFFISGIIGKFIAGIPYTIIFVLIASIFVSLGIVPIIAVLFTKQENNRLERMQEEYTNRATLWYKKMLRALLLNDRRQRIFIWSLVGLFVVSLALPFTGLVQATFFPQDDQDFVIINIEKPQGTVLEETDLAVRQVEEILYANAKIESFTTTVGQSSSLTGQGSSGSNQGNITVNLPEKRSFTSTDVANELQRELVSIRDANVQILQATNGPPSGAPIQIQFKGENLDELITAADKGRQLLGQNPNVRNITSSTKNNGTEFELTIDRAKAAALGLNPQVIGTTLRAAVNGVKATTIRQPNNDVDVVVKLNLNPDFTDASNTANATVDSIKNLTIQTPSGPALLGSVLKDSLGQSKAVIAHQDKLRIETVSAYPADTTTAGEVVEQFKKDIAQLNLPDSVIVTYGGETEDITRSFTEMFVALIAGLVLMFMILILSFNSIRYTLQLLVIVPLSLIGVLDGLALTGQPVSFTSLLGIIALGGVIINHANILMDSMIQHLKEEPSKPLIDVVIDSSATRLRPIALTTITTVIGMIPLSLSNPTWGPLAYSVMFGLTFAICLTLVLVPVLFYRAPHHERDPIER